MRYELVSLSLAAAFAVTGIGCDAQPGGGNEPADGSAMLGDMPPDTVTSTGDHEGDSHAHPEHGPHGGDLIELGEEEYHGELVHDEKGVTVYLLDSTVKKAVPIESESITINLKRDGKPEQVRLQASPQEGEEGKSSRFISQNQDLGTRLDDEESAPRLMVTIDGRAFNAPITHDHAGHDHAGH